MSSFDPSHTWLVGRDWNMIGVSINPVGVGELYPN